MIEVLNGGGAGSVEEAVLFPFDDHSIPYRAGLRLQLVLLLQLLLLLQC